MNVPYTNSKFLIISVLFSVLFMNCSNEEKLSDINKIKNKIIERLNKCEGDFAIAFKDLQDGRSILINENEVFHAASTMKTPVMIEVFNQIDQGKLNLNDSIIISNQFKSIVDGSAYSMDLGDDSDDSIYREIGLKMSIYELLYQMITVSSNLATNILIEKVGAENVQKTMLDWQAKNIKVLRGVEDTKAFENGLNNTTTALDLLKIFEGLDQAERISKNSHSQIIEILKKQKFREIIPAKLPRDVKVAHKTGSINGVQHDSGIVYLPNGKKYVLILLSKNLKNTEEGVKTLSEVSKIIYDIYEN
jgi:beta-lactamase class A